MKDPWNPTSQELREWAFDPDSVVPITDFDLALTWAQNERVYLDLASDDACPKRRYFLAVLYFMVGHAVGNGFQDRPRPIVEGLIANGENFSHHDIRIWQRRSRYLLTNPDTFDFDEWCGGRLAKA